MGGSVPWLYAGGITERQARMRDAERAARKNDRKAPPTKPLPPSKERQAKFVPRPKVQTLEEAILANMPVPVPAERVRPEDVTYISREGQSVFRETMLAMYGKCAISGCTVREALEAAHIVPYVDRRSNIVSNGLCLRADIHRLYDRNLIRINGSRRISCDASLMATEYWKFHGHHIEMPASQEDWPNKELLAVRHRFIEGGE